jgi:acyl-CoA thioester hydrolase
MDDARNLTALLPNFPVVVVQDVAWGDMDAYQHVNNVVYFRYFENARLEYLRRIGWLALREATGVGPILASTQARYRRALTYPDAVAIGARVIEVQEDRFVLEHRIASRRLGEIATEGQALIVSFDYRAGKKTPLPAAVRQRVEELEGGQGSG